MIDQGRDEEKNNPTPYIKYFLQIVLACYKAFEERGSGRSTYYVKIDMDIDWLYPEQ